MDSYMNYRFGATNVAPRAPQNVSKGLTERIHSISEIHPEEIGAQRRTYCLPRIHRKEERIACHVSIGKVPPKVGQANRKKNWRQIEQIVKKQLGNSIKGESTSIQWEWMQALMVIATKYKKQRRYKVLVGVGADFLELMTNKFRQWQNIQDTPLKTSSVQKKLQLHF